MWQRERSELPPSYATKRENAMQQLAKATFVGGGVKPLTIEVIEVHHGSVTVRCTKCQGELTVLWLSDDDRDEAGWAWARMIVAHARVHSKKFTHVTTEAAVP